MTQSMTPSPSATKNLPSSPPILPATKDLIKILNPSSGDIAALLTYLDTAREDAAEFSKKYLNEKGDNPKVEYQISTEEWDRIDSWLSTETGRKFIDDFCSQVFVLLDNTSQHGLPGHDARHILFKDPTAGIRISIEEGLSNAENIFLFAALLHDVGRFPEPALPTGPQSGVLAKDHALIGFKVIQGIVDSTLDTNSCDFETSQALFKMRDALLNAILVHQRGSCLKDPVAQRVQEADRLQLVGAEGVTRFIQSDVGEFSVSLKAAENIDRKTSLALPGRTRDLFEHTEFYMRNLFKNTSKFGEEHSDELKVVSGIFLSLAAPDTVYQQIFFPEIEEDHGRPSVAIQGPGQGGKKPLSTQVWNRIKEGPTGVELTLMDEKSDNFSLEELMRAVVDAPGSGLPSSRTESWRKIANQLADLNQDEQERLKRGLAYVLVKREESDSYEKTLLQIGAKRPAGSIVNEVSTYILNKLATEMQGN